MSQCGSWQTATWSLAGGVVLLTFLLLWRHARSVFCRHQFRFHAAASDGFRVRGTGEHPTLPQLGEGSYHLFISHTWRSGQDQPAVIKRQLQLYLPKARPRIFLDVDDLEDIAQIEEHIQSSTVACLFLSKGYFFSRACLNEVRACMAMSKPLILVHEREIMHGGVALSDLFDACPLDLRKYVFGARDRISETCDVIRWQRLADFHVASLTRIAEALLRECRAAAAAAESGPPLGGRLSSGGGEGCVATTSSCGPRGLLQRMGPRVLEREGSRARLDPDGAGGPIRRQLYLPSATSEQPAALSGHVEALVSSANGAALEVANDLAEALHTAPAASPTAAGSFRKSRLPGGGSQPHSGGCCSSGGGGGGGTSGSTSGGAPGAALAVTIFPATIDALLQRIDRAVTSGSRVFMLLLLDKTTFALGSERVRHE